MLKTKKLTVHYGSLLALHEISLEVKKGEIIALIGPNRAGKSTLLLTLSGILNTSEGRILFEEEDIANLDPHRIVSRGIGHVPQWRHIFPTLSVTDNLMMGAHIRRKAKEEIKGDLEQVYQLFPILQERKRQRSGTLSGGEQQMLAIGRALMGRPKLLMLDEPSSGLAPRFIEEIFAKLAEMNKKGLTLFIVEQEISLILSISHRGYLLRNGRLVKEGPCCQSHGNPEVKGLLSVLPSRKSCQIGGSCLARRSSSGASRRVLNHLGKVVEPFFLKGDSSPWNERNGGKPESEGFFILVPKGEVEKNRIRSIVVVPCEENLLHLLNGDPQIDPLIFFLLRDLERELIPLHPEPALPPWAFYRESSIIVCMTRFRSIHI